MYIILSFSLNDLGLRVRYLEANLERLSSKFGQNSFNVDLLGYKMPQRW